MHAGFTNLVVSNLSVEGMSTAAFAALAWRALIFIFLAGVQPALATSLPASLAAISPDVIHYDTRLRPDLVNKTIAGRATLRIRSTHHDAFAITLDAGALSVSSVRERARVLAFEKRDKQLIIRVPAARAATREITIEYSGAPKFGLNFLTDAEQIFTAFSTDEWMPCNSSPDDRATFYLALEVPRGYKVVANGDHIFDEAPHTKRGTHIVSHWQMNDPQPAYVLGFAVGEFREVIDDAARPRLRYLVSPHFTDADVHAIFRETRDMIAYYERVSGIQYPDNTYTQVLVQRGAAQEAAGFALMSDAYGRRVLADATNVWLAAHELSHQWWGNRITNVAWTEFWLNEGIASFLNATYLEQRFGRAQYDHMIGLAQTKYEKIRAEGRDKSLVFSDWNNPTAQDRSLVYDKGALVMHQLRKHMGEPAFWDGLRLFTKRYWGRSVRSQDLQQTMEIAAGQSLQTLFDEWVYLAKP